MRPLPRLLAFTDNRIAALDDLGIRAAGIAAVGPAVALVARLPSSSADDLAALSARFVALARPPQADVLVTGRGDVALSTGAQGVILRSGDLKTADIRGWFAGPAANRWCLRSVHSEDEARAAVDDGADALIAGTIWPSATHPERPGAGRGFLSRIIALGLPTFAIGGVTAARAVEAFADGAWGVAAISAVWDADRPYRAAREILAAWN
jgi:thiamine-phosphate pyrophosphorylase